MQNLVTKLNPVFLDIKSLQKVHASLTTGKAFGDFINSSNKLRIGNGEINPSITFKCSEQKINNDVLLLFDDYDLKTTEGYPLLTLKEIVNCPDDKALHSGKLVFYKNASVPIELNRWLVDFNDTLARYENNKVIEIAPYSYLADMRRWFSALAPFSYGNEDVADALMLYATKRLHLPPLGQKIKNPYLLTMEDNRKRSEQDLKKNLTFFSSCLYEIKTNLVSTECSPLN